MTKSGSVDERVRQIKHQATNYGFGIFLLGTILIILRRQFILGQHASEYFDLVIVLSIAASVTVLFSVLNGAPAFDSDRLGKRTLLIAAVISITVLLTGIYHGQVDTFWTGFFSFIKTFASSLVGLFALDYLYRRWESQI